MKTPTPPLPPVGTRAKVAPVSTVTRDLHNLTGTVSEHRHSITSGCTVAVLEFDTPAPRHYSPTTPLKTIGLRADQIEPTT